MPQAKSECTEQDAERAGSSSVNDNDQPPSNAITLTELAAVMQTDEDALLQRLAGILRKREDGPSAEATEE
jgi:hypothetical protein